MITYILIICVECTHPTIVPGFATEQTCMVAQKQLAEKSACIPTGKADDKINKQMFDLFIGTAEKFLAIAKESNQ